MAHTPRFVIVDHSLRKLGGHHYEYAMTVSRAAVAAGLRVVLATNRRLHQRDFPADAEIHALFPHKTYSRHTIYVRHKTSIARDAAGSAREARPPGRLAAWIAGVARRRHVAGFARACRETFRRVPLERGDQVFLPTMSELDLLGLTEFLAAEPATRAADWHLQFHYSIFRGREPDYAEQPECLAELREAFRRALARVPGHRLHFYNPTDALGEQYRRLEVASFRTLDYPVGEAFLVPPEVRPRGEPVRVTIGGQVREEKGYGQLDELASALWDDYLASGRAQLIVQARPQRVKLAVPPGAVAEASDPRALPATPIVQPRYPLGREDYAAFVRGSGIGLLNYQSEQYYVRCSGVLVEMLSAGVPVVVSAGCWLAEQVAESIHRHHEALARELPALGSPDRGSAERAFDARPLEEALEVPRGAGALLVRFRRLAPTGPGTYVRLDASERNADGAEIRSRSATVGWRAPGEPLTALFALGAGTSRVSLRWSNAYRRDEVRVTGVERSFLVTGSLPGGRCPTGAVGLIAADAAQVVPHVSEMIDLWSHYRSTAVAFAAPWQRRHSGSRVVETLLASAGER